MSFFPRFLTTMDARAWRAVAVSLALFVVVGAVLVLGKSGVIATDELPFQGWIERASESHWALFAVILLFTVSSFVGAPQFVLIAAVVVALDPVRGFLYAWIATLVSASLNFWLGRAFGADILRRYGGDKANRLSRFVGRNGVVAAALVRVVPSAPFIVVNMAMGVSHMKFWEFLAGTAVGVVPKTALVAFAGGGVLALLGGAGWTTAALIAAGLGIWIGLMLVARSRLAQGGATLQEDASATRKPARPGDD